LKIEKNRVFRIKKIVSQHDPKRQAIARFELAQSEKPNSLNSSQKQLNTIQTPLTHKKPQKSR
jgi:hypothetical protein